MEKNTIKLYGNKAFGVEVSEYGLENGYLDYRALGIMVGDKILNNTIRDRTIADWEIISGEFRDQVFQDYIISEGGYEFLSEYTDELVFYNENLDLYIWAITHFGTAWDYVLSGVKLVNTDDIYDIVKENTKGLDAIYEDYIIELVGYDGLGLLLQERLIESCGVIGERQLYALVE